MHTATPSANEGEQVAVDITKDIHGRKRPPEILLYVGSFVRVDVPWKNALKRIEIVGRNSSARVSLLR
jgi:hypothetical protein